MKHFLRLSSLLLLLFAACSAPYKRLQEESANGQSAYIYKPVLDKIVYRCVINGRVVFKKFHLSGILLFKKLENGTVRAIFQNEMGYTFFDFEWDSNDSFIVKQVIPQLDKPALIKTLKKDMNLLLMKGLDRKTEKLYTKSRGKERYYRFTLERGYTYYIEESGKLARIENAGEKKKVITIDIKGKTTADAMPDTVFFNHHKANFTIELNKIEQHVDE